MQRILIARLSAMGDIVHSLPAVAALRRAFPQATIGWAIEERWVELLAAKSAARSGARSAQRPLVDAIHTIDTRAWRSAPFSPATWRTMKAAVAELRAQNYDCAVDMQAAIRSALLNRLSRAPQRFGFAQPREPLAKIFYTRAVETPARHVVEQGLQLAAAIIGQEQLAVDFPLPCDADVESWTDHQINGKEFVLLNPGAGWGAKRWPVERYAEVARALASDGLQVLVNCGPGEEPIAQQIAAADPEHIKPVASSLGQLMALVRRARLFIGGDTGPVHLAAALRVPVVAIYGPTDPARNGPYGPMGSNHTIAVLRSPQSTTSHARRAAPESGLLQITVSEVLAAARRLLEQKR